MRSKTLGVLAIGGLLCLSGPAVAQTVGSCYVPPVNVYGVNVSCGPAYPAGTSYGSGNTATISFQNGATVGSAGQIQITEISLPTVLNRTSFTYLENNHVATTAVQSTNNLSTTVVNTSTMPFASVLAQSNVMVSVVQCLAQPLIGSGWTTACNIAQSIAEMGCNGAAAAACAVVAPLGTSAANSACSQATKAAANCVDAAKAAGDYCRAHV